MKYIAEWNKNMNGLEDFQTRMGNFEWTDAFIQEHNSYESSWTAGHNQFSDWSREEYRGMLGYIADDEEHEDEHMEHEARSLSAFTGWDCTDD